MTTSQQLINQSARTNSVVWTDDASLLADLKAASDDNVAANGGVVEVWGTTDDGDEWRVHVRTEVV